MAKSPNSSSAMRGFTLLELLVVMYVLVLALSIVVPNMRSSEATMFNAELRSVASLLNHARRRAIVEAEPASAVLETGPRPADTALADDGLEQDQDVLRWHSESISLAYQGGPDDNIEAREDITVRFFPQGGSSGGTLHFSKEQFSGRIRLDPVSGRIEVAFHGKSFDAGQ